MSDNDSNEIDSDTSDESQPALPQRRILRSTRNAARQAELDELEAELNEIEEVQSEEEQEEPAVEQPAQRRSLDLLPEDDDEEEEPVAAGDEAEEQPEPEIEAQPEAELQPTVEQEQAQQEEAAAADEPSTSQRVQDPPQNEDVINLSTPSPPKKRKRLSLATPKNVGTPVANPTTNDAEEDDGMTCPICLESWEMSGEHRLVSLRCGHLFGDSCIRRWLTESQRQSAVKVCPQCKTKASNRDIRCLYAKRLRAIDRTEEHDMRRELDGERRRTQQLTTELATVKMTLSLTSNKLTALQVDNDRLRMLLRSGTHNALSDDLESGGSLKSSGPQRVHRLYMEKNMDISREPGCRVLLYSATHSALLASQPSSQGLFPGYGVRFIDPHSFKTQNFLHTSRLQVRDIALGESMHLLTVASREPIIKTFDLRTQQYSATFNASDKPLWSCSLDRNERQHFLYGGDLRGGIHVFDVRQADTVLSQFLAEDNFSPVINIAPVPAGKVFPNGGFLVCQLSILKFFEYADNTAVATRLNVDGPFLSMQYDVVQDTVLISARSNANHLHSRFILAKLDKIDGTTVLDVKATVYGSSGTPYMTRPTQLGIDNNTLIVGYLQDSKQLMMYDVQREQRAQTMAASDVIYDICPVGTRDGSYLAALTDTKCRIYKVNSSAK